MLDRFVVGRVTRISPEAPVPVVRFEREYSRLGGAANVAQNLAALGAQVSLVGVVGRDDAAARLRALLGESGIPAEGLVADGARPTVEKVRVVTDRNQQVAESTTSGTPMSNQTSSGSLSSGSTRRPAAPTRCSSRIT